MQGEVCGNAHEQGGCERLSYLWADVVQCRFFDRYFHGHGGPKSAKM